MIRRAIGETEPHGGVSPPEPHAQSGATMADRGPTLMRSGQVLPDRAEPAADLLASDVGGLVKALLQVGDGRVHVTLVDGLAGLLR